jgi:hypothetical protein
MPGPTFAPLEPSAAREGAAAEAIPSFGCLADLPIIAIFHSPSLKLAN